MGTESGVLRKKGVFGFLFFSLFLAVFARGVVFFHIFWCLLGFSWWNLVQTQILAPRKHCFFEFFGITCLSNISWQSAFCFFFPDCLANLLKQQHPSCLQFCGICGSVRASAQLFLHLRATPLCVGFPSLWLVGWRSTGQAGGVMSACSCPLHLSALFVAVFRHCSTVVTHLATRPRGVWPPPPTPPGSPGMHGAGVWGAHF